jgi:ribosomal protein S18 acetylase RimI-like enzyme
MHPICIHDRDELESFLRRDTFLHLYGLGDLDDAAWPFTTWHGVRRGGRLAAVILVYTRYESPVVLVLGQNDDGAIGELLRGAIPRLPQRFYAHLSPGLEDALTPHYSLTPHGEHRKMALAHPARLETVDVSNVVQLTPADAEDAKTLYREGYPGNHFRPSELDGKPYVGVRGSEGLIAIAGVHAYSERYGVAALGNITTHPDHRDKGYGKAVTARLCGLLRDRVRDIGLNVNADNTPAIACYRALGFEVAHTYSEYEVGAPRMS